MRGAPNVYLAEVPSARAFGAARCQCGGTLTLTTELQFGRSVERCDGPCGYHGAPRPVVKAPVEPAPATVEVCSGAMDERTVRLCCEPNCGQRTYTPRAARCDEHRKERQKHYVPKSASGKLALAWREWLGAYRESLDAVQRVTETRPALRELGVNDAVIDGYAARVRKAGR